MKVSGWPIGLISKKEYHSISERSKTSVHRTFHKNAKANIPLRRKTNGFGALHWVTPPTRRFCVTRTNMLISKNPKICVSPNVNFKICVSPNAKPQHESVEYRLRWVPNAKCSRWPCTFHVVCVNFICVW